MDAIDECREYQPAQRPSRDQNQYGQQSMDLRSRNMDSRKGQQKNGSKYGQQKKKYAPEEVWTAEDEPKKKYAPIAI